MNGQLVEIMEFEHAYTLVMIVNGVQHDFLINATKAAELLGKHQAKASHRDENKITHYPFKTA